MPRTILILLILLICTLPCRREDVLRNRSLAAHNEGFHAFEDNQDQMNRQWEWYLEDPRQPAEVLLIIRQDGTRIVPDESSGK